MCLLNCSSPQEKNGKMCRNPEFIENILRPMEKAKGDSLPVSTFYPLADGTFPAGTTAYEKRGIAAFIPEWIEKNCIQCNQCSYICPHACIRPFLLNERNRRLHQRILKARRRQEKSLQGIRSGYRLVRSTVQAAAIVRTSARQRKRRLSCSLPQSR